MRFSEFTNDKCFSVFIAFTFLILTFLIYAATGSGFVTHSNYFTWLADAFLHGRLGLTKASHNLDELVPVNGRFYVIYPPMPAILLMPFVAIWGPTFSQTLGSVFVASADVSLFYLLMRRLTHDVRIQIWMTLLLSFGTIHWYIASVGSAWYFAHVTSFLFLTLAIYETFSKRRPFLIGLLLGASYWSRLPTVLSLPFFLIMLSDKWLSKSNSFPLLGKINFIPLLKLGLGVVVFIILNFGYNYLRFGSPLDIAYSLQARQEPDLYPRGLFAISYLPKHLWIFFLKPPVFISKPPYIVPSLMGMSILFTTPAFIYSIFAGMRNKLALACWSAIFPIAFVEFIHGGVGWTQFGYRFAMDFYPFLLLLTVKGFGNEIRWEHKLLICVGVLVNLWGVLWINKFHWSSLYG